MPHSLAVRFHMASSRCQNYKYDILVACCTSNMVDIRKKRIMYIIYRPINEQAKLPLISSHTLASTATRSTLGNTIKHAVLYSTASLHFFHSLLVL